MSGTESGKRAIGPKILIVLVATIVSLGIIEAGLRLILGNCRVVPMVAHPGDGRCTGLEPGGSSVYTGWFLKVPAIRQEANDLGYRGPELPRARRDGVFRVAVVGDSFTYGQGVASDQSIPSRIEARIREATGQDVEVMNFGIPGLNLEECFDQYRHFASGWKPDVVLYLLFANDLGEPMCSMLERRTHTWFLLNVYLFRVAYAAFASDHLMGDDASPAEMKSRLSKVLRDFAAAVDGGDARLAVGVLANPLNNDKLLADILGGTEINWIDVRKAVKRMPDEIMGEGHYSPEGNDVVASALADWLIARYLPQPE